MSKELEAFRDILGILSAVSGCEVDMNSERVITVKQALQSLEAIKNSKPSEALRCLEKVKGYHTGGIISDEEFLEETEEYNTIKQALLKAQEQEKENARYKKVLETIKEKEVDFYSLRRCKTLKEYNTEFMIDEYQYLTQEEFNLLKEWQGER